MIKHLQSNFRRKGLFHLTVCEPLSWEVSRNLEAWKYAEAVGVGREGPALC